MTHAGVPFIILSLPRSRSFWLSRALSCAGYHCEHEQARHARGLDDVRSWLAQGWTGTAETSAAPWYRLIRHLRPDIAIVVVRRPVGDVVDSLMRLDLRGVCGFDRVALERQMRRQDRYLDRVERLPGVLSVQAADLSNEAVFAKVFEHCLHVRHDPEWWAALAPANLQCDMPALMRYAIMHRAQMVRTGTAVRRQLYRVLHPDKVHVGPVAEDGITFQEERLGTFWPDAQKLFAEHCVAVGEPEDQYMRKNLPMIQRLEDLGAWHFLTARCNGRMLGYLASVVAPSMEDPNRITATQTLFYASPDARYSRIGMRLQRASLEALKAKGVSQVLMRAGVRGSGPKLGVFYRRLGAEDFGQLYSLDLEAA